jgi:major membrane immunogen (membrane-anchored lipoprotein)
VASIVALSSALVLVLSSSAHAAGTIAQVAPLGSTTTPTSSTTFTDQLATTGGEGVSFTTTAPSDALSVSSSGAITTVGGPLSEGTYTASGQDSNGSGDTGTWSYTLTVVSTPITQIAPFSNASLITPLASNSFTSHLEVTGDDGAGVTFVTTSGSSGLTVSTGGLIETTGTLDEDSYTASGTDVDGSGDTGTWSYSLTVSATAITQGAPTTGSTMPAASSGFTDTLSTTGGAGAISYDQLTGSPSVFVSTSGDISVPATLAAGQMYTASGADADQYGDSGTWSYALTVSATSITQGAPTSNSTTPGASRSFTAQLEVSGGAGTISYVQSTRSPSLSVSASGVVSVPSPLAKGVYTATGTDSDTFGDTGTWSYTLTVSATAITQTAPFSNGTTVITPTTSPSFTHMLSTTGSDGSVTFTTNSTRAPSGVTATIKVSSSGSVTTTGTLDAGIYTASGSDADRFGDTGSWSYSLTVTASKITQGAPTKATIQRGSPFTSQLTATGGVGTITYTQSGGAPSVTVSSSGKVSAPATLATGKYEATGSESDTYGDVRGIWSFTLTVTPTKITQATPEIATITTDEGFTSQLKVSGSHGTVTYLQSTGAPYLKVSSSGVVSAPATLVARTYRATGTDSDSYGDLNGAWSFTLTVTGTRITQEALATASTVTGRGFTGELKVSGSHGKLTYTQSIGAPRVKVSSSGKVSALADLAAGTYKSTGASRDAYGDTGTWRVTLTVKAQKLTQHVPVAATVTGGETYSGRLEVSGSHGIVTYTQLTGAPHLKVAASGRVSALASLAVGTYKATGTAKDALGDRGAWSFTLVVRSNKITQVAPASATAATGKAFTVQLKVSGSRGTITYTQLTGLTHLLVSASGKVSTMSTLAAGTYKATGSVKDGLGDRGLWSFTLTVAAGKFTQVSPVTATITTGKAFRVQLRVSGATGTVTYAQTKGAPQLKVSTSGKVSAPATLAAGTYKATGTAKDKFGDKGTWRFILKVKGQKLIQLETKSGSVTSGKALTGQLKVSGALGNVTYKQLTGLPSVTVSASGQISAPATLAVATYTVSGIDRDSRGDKGTWSYTLTVTGAMSPQ